MTYYSIMDWGVFRTAGIVRVCGIIDSNQRHKNVCKRIDEKRFEKICEGKV